MNKKIDGQTDRNIYQPMNKMLTIYNSKSYPRCIRKYKDAAYCTCLAKNEGKTKTELAKICPLPKPPKGKGKVPNDYELMEQSKIKYKEEMFHHYFAWYLLMQVNQQPCFVELIGLKIYNE